MVDFPKIDLDAPLDFESDEEFEKATAPKTFKGFEPGEHVASIVNAELFEGNSGSIYLADPTWFKVRVEFTDPEEREANALVMVPTSTAKHTKNGKTNYFMYNKFKEFMLGIGEECTQSTFRKLVQKYFTSEKGLKSLAGKKVKFTMGFDKPYHIDYQGKGDVRLYDVKKKEHVILDDNVENGISCNDKDSVLLMAAEKGIDVENHVQQFPSITSYAAKKQIKKVEKKAEEPAPDFDDGDDGWD